MDSRSTTSKNVRPADKNFEGQLLQWFDEYGSDVSEIQDECAEETHIESNNNIGFEEEGK